MRKQELVHLHSLLVEITVSQIDKGAVSANIWTEYDALCVDSYSIHAQKGDHQEAVLLLGSTLRETLEQPTEDQYSIPGA